MAGLEKEARRAVKKAEETLKKGTEGKKESGGKKKKGNSSGADKAKRAAKELLK